MFTVSCHLNKNIKYIFIFYNIIILEYDIPNLSYIIKCKNKLIKMRDNYWRST